MHKFCKWGWIMEHKCNIRCQVKTHGVRVRPPTKFNFWDIMEGKTTCYIDFRFDWLGRSYCSNIRPVEHIRRIFGCFNRKYAVLLSSYPIFSIIWLEGKRLIPCFLPKNVFASPTLCMRRCYLWGVASSCTRWPLETLRDLRRFTPRLPRIQAKLESDWRWMKRSDDGEKIKVLYCCIPVCS